MTEHVAKPVFQRGWGEWLAECTCGWRGDYVTSEARSKRNAEEHVAEQELANKEPS